MKKIITTIATCLTFSISFAQNTSLSTEKTTPRKNTIYFEIFGQGLINSINYDRQLIVNEKSATSVTVGFAHWGYAINNPELKESYTGIPISFNYLLRKNNHNLELGIGITQMYTQMEWDMTSIYAPIASLFSEETITVKTSGEISTT